MRVKEQLEVEDCDNDGVRDVVMVSERVGVADDVGEGVQVVVWVWLRVAVSDNAEVIDTLAVPELVPVHDRLRVCCPLRVAVGVGVHVGVDVAV